MRDDYRSDEPIRKRPQSVSPRPQTRGTAQKRPIARPSTMAQSAQVRTKPVARPTARREAPTPYPDEAYYRKQPPYAAGRPMPARTNGAKKKKKRKKRTNWLHVIFYSVVAVAVALLVSYLLRTFVFEIVQVSTDAMHDTLLEGDWVLVTKFDYWSNNPQRNDIVSVKVSGLDGVIIRRVVGMPGETIEMPGDDTVLIDGIVLPEAHKTLASYDAFPSTKLRGGRYFVLSDNRQVTLDSRDSKVDQVPKNQLNKVRAIVWPLDRRGNL